MRLKSRIQEQRVDKKIHWALGTFIWGILMLVYAEFVVSLFSLGIALGHAFLVQTSEKPSEPQVHELQSFMNFEFGSQIMGIQALRVQPQSEPSGRQKQILQPSFFVSPGVHFFSSASRRFLSSVGSSLVSGQFFNVHDFIKPSYEHLHSLHPSLKTLPGSHFCVLSATGTPSNQKIRHFSIFVFSS